MMKIQEREEEFAARFARRADELKWLYMELYHNDRQAWEYFAGMLCRAWEARPEALRQADREREANPDWYRCRKTVGMQLYVKQFAGTLRGVKEKLDYIRECGVNLLHLLPLLECPAGKSDGGYAVSDYRKVQPELGTMDDLEDLAAECRRQGISLCLDFVMNHTSEDHEWARRARAGETEFQNRYFFYDSWDIPNWYEQAVTPVFPVTAPGSFTWCEDAKRIVMTTFYPYQWDLNYANPAVFNDMTDNLLFLCNRGADVIRLDALPCLWKAPGTSCRDLPQVHSIVRMLRLVCEIVCPGTLLLGEAVTEHSRVGAYFGTEERPECHLLYNAVTMATLWHTVATRDARLMNHELEMAAGLPKRFVFLNYLRCHDDITWTLDWAHLLWNYGWAEVPHKQYLNDYLTGAFPGSKARGEKFNEDPRRGDARLCGTTASLCGIEAARAEGTVRDLAEAIRLDGMLHAFLFTLSGIPVLYSGDEIAQENDYTWHEDGRDLHRGAMDWEKAEKRKDRDSTEGQVFREIRRLEKLWAKHGAFDQNAEMRILDTKNDQVLGIAREYRGETLLALFNFSKDPQMAKTGEEGLYSDLITGRRCKAAMLKVESGGYRWLYQKTGGKDEKTMVPAG